MRTRRDVVREEIHFRGGSVMEVEVKDVDLFKMGPMHKPSDLIFHFSEEAKQYVPYLESDEVVAVKVTDLGERGGAKREE